ncbi:hypothetical protein [Mycolicibacterium cosmeticum]|uniref:hypothetical protein n=1 Tax=Mycolicibacterium cosmeticum TaxID=258533 RepID=UPI003204BA73
MAGADVAGMDQLRSQFGYELSSDRRVVTRRPQRAVLGLEPPVVGNGRDPFCRTHAPDSGPMSFAKSCTTVKRRGQRDFGVTRTFEGGAVSGGKK